MRALGQRVEAVGWVIAPQPDRAFLAYARAVVAYGGGEPGGEAPVGLTRWLETGRKDTR